MGEIFKGVNISSVRREDEKVIIIDEPTIDELKILSCFKYKENDAVLHNDTNALFKDKKAYAAWNYKTNGDEESVTLSYWINVLQNLDSNKEYFVSLNETQNLEN